MVHTPQLRRTSPRPSDTHNCAHWLRRGIPLRQRTRHAPHFGLSFTERVSSGSRRTLPIYIARYGELFAIGSESDAGRRASPHLNHSSILATTSADDAGF